MNKNAIKDAIDLLKKFKEADEIFVKQSERLFQGMDSRLTNFFDHGLNIKKENIKKANTTIAQLSMMLYSKK
jgi:hypothetical protein